VGSGGGAPAGCSVSVPGDSGDSEVPGGVLMVVRSEPIIAGFSGPCPFDTQCAGATAVYVVRADGKLDAKCVSCDKAGELGDWFFQE